MPLVDLVAAVARLSMRAKRGWEIDFCIYSFVFARARALIDVSLA